MLFNLDVK